MICIKETLDTLSKEGGSSKVNLYVRAGLGGKVNDYIISDPKASGTGENLLKNVQGGRKDSSISITSKTAVDEFIKMGMKKFPAKHYLVVFSGHSMDYRPLLPDIKKAFQEATAGGKKVDVVSFASCTMSQAEIMGEFKGTAKAAVASEELFTNEWPLDKFVRILKNDEKRKYSKPEKLAEKIVKESNQVTTSAINLDKLDEVEKHVKELGQNILKVENKKDLDLIKDIARKSQHFYQNYPGDARHGLVDIYDFAKSLGKNPEISKTYPDLAKSALELAKSLREGKGAIIAEEHAPSSWEDYVIWATQLVLSPFSIVLTGSLPYFESVGRAHGLSFFLPLKDGYEDFYLYHPSTDFFKNTGWDKVIKHLVS